MRKPTAQACEHVPCDAAKLLARAQHGLWYVIYRELLLVDRIHAELLDTTNRAQLRSMSSQIDPLQPPSIAYLREMGLSGIHVSCTASSCRNAGHLPWDRLSLDGNTAFTEITALRRFRCNSCGNRSVHIMPDWGDYRASGMGPRQIKTPNRES